jgi:hypothetical protein
MSLPAIDQVLPAVSRIIEEEVRLVGPTDRGESRSTFFLVGQSGDLVLKLVPDGPEIFSNQLRLLRLVASLRAQGYPAPEYLGAGQADKAVFTVQRRVAGQTLEPGPGLPPAQELFSGVVPDLLVVVELQAGAGDLVDPPWPERLLTTIEQGGDGYCLHETMFRRSDTAALLGRLQDVARRNSSSPSVSRDIVHFDLNPANVLHQGGRLSGVVDWNVPFTGASQGDRGFDVATMLFYSYDLEPTRELLWERATDISGLSWTSVYLCHLVLRQVEWSRRHKPDSDEERRFLTIATRVLEDCERRGA